MNDVAKSGNTQVEYLNKLHCWLSRMSSINKSGVALVGACVWAHLQIQGILEYYTLSIMAYLHLYSTPPEVHFLLTAPPHLSEGSCVFSDNRLRPRSTPVPDVLMRNVCYWMMNLFLRKEPSHKRSWNKWWCNRSWRRILNQPTGCEMVHIIQSNATHWD